MWHDSHQFHVIRRNICLGGKVHRRGHPPKRGITLIHETCIVWMWRDSCKWDRQLRHANETGNWDRQMRQAIETGKWDRQLRQANETGNWHRQLRQAIETGNWHRQLRQANETGKWDRQLRLSNETGKWDRRLRNDYLTRGEGVFTRESWRIRIEHVMTHNKRTWCDA